MASIINRPNGHRWIQFVSSDGKHKTLRLGKTNLRAAEQHQRIVEALLQNSIARLPMDIATAEFIGALEGTIRVRYENSGLLGKVEKKQAAGPMKLGPYVEWYLSRRKVKESTRKTWEKVQGNLVTYFGADRSIDSITPGDAMAWREWLASEGNIREGKVRKNKDGKEFHGRKDLGDNTVRRRSGIAKQFFNYAIESKLITENPFVKLSASVHGNDARQYFISLELFESVIEAAPGAEWEAIIALSRLGGLRCPSETLRLRWEDIDFANGRIRVHASKTEHHKDGGIRYCPLFPELRPYLEDLRELAIENGAQPSDPVIATHRGSEAILRTGLMRILKKAGVKPWPKLFHNMRASRETELLDEFPIKDVCSWIGNTQAVAMKHYAMMRDASFTRAAGLPNRMENGGSCFAPKQKTRENEGTVENGVRGSAENPGNTADSRGKEGNEWAILAPNTSQITNGKCSSDQPEAKEKINTLPQRVMESIEAIEQTRQMLFGGGWAPEQDPWVARALEASGVLIRALKAIDTAKEARSHAKV